MNKLEEAAIKHWAKIFEQHANDEEFGHRCFDDVMLGFFLAKGFNLETTLELQKKCYDLGLF